MFIGYASNSAAYRFLVLKSDVLECNTIIKIKNAEFFEHIFPLSKKISHTPTIVDDIENSYDEHVSTTVDDMESSHDKLRRSNCNTPYPYIIPFTDMVGFHYVR